MIVLNVTYQCKPGTREAFLQKIEEEGIDAASRREGGNIKYDYYLSAEDSDELLLVEKWKDSEALSAHAKMPHFIRLGALKEEYVEKTSVERFEKDQVD